MTPFFIIAIAMALPLASLLKAVALAASTSRFPVAVFNDQIIAREFMAIFAMGFKPGIIQFNIVAFWGWSICTLFLECRPAAITRFIVAVIVDTINRAAFWAFTQVSKEILKQPPSITDFDASCPVMFPRFVIRVSALLDHGSPANMSASSVVTVFPVHGMNNTSTYA